MTFLSWKKKEKKKKKDKHSKLHQPYKQNIIYVISSLTVWKTFCEIIIDEEFVVLPPKHSNQLKPWAQQAISQLRSCDFFTSRNVCFAENQAWSTITGSRDGFGADEILPSQ